MLSLGILLILTVPVALSVLGALTFKGKNHGKPLLGFFLNRPAGWGILFISLAAILVQGSLWLFDYGACETTATGAVTCQHIASELGRFLSEIFLVGFPLMLSLYLPAFLLLHVVEHLTKRRAKRSGSGD